MLGSRAKWQFLSDDYEQTSNTQLNIMDILLRQRGIITSDEAHKFISPDLADLLSPSKLAMIDLASERIKEAILAEEKILVYGDYDADGVCSTALLLNAFKELGADCDFYIPNRFEEGYGLNKQAFQFAYDNGFRVIITVDTGIASHGEVDFANELGLDVIITDHHDSQGSVPNSYAVIHPECSPKYEFKQLAGVGVAFKLAQHLLGYFPNHLLDLVAIGTIADLVPLIDENRVLAKFGLQTLSNTKNKGLIALKKACRIEGMVTEEDVGFRIGPRLNAVGRLQDADLAVHLLMTESAEEANELVQEIDSINEERQQIVRDIVQEAEEEMKDIPDKSVIIVAKSNWHEGVLGIVASRLVQKYHCPAFVLTIDETTNEVKGSARSIPAFHLFNSCMKIRDLFTNFGGHSQAAGMTFPLENMEKIANYLNEMLGELKDEDFKETIEISKTLSIGELNEEIVEEISKLAPFGMANPKPVFHLEETPNQIQQIGRMKDHLKIQYRGGKQRVEGIGFRMGEQYNQISSQAVISIVGELGINEWNGFKTVQIIIQDIKIDEWQLFDHRGKKDFDPNPYIQQRKCLIVTKHDEIGNNINQADDVNIITYESDFNKLPHAKQLFIYELPADLKILERLITATKPEQIHVCYYIKDSAYLQAFPTREEFKWLYAYILKKKSFNIKQEIPIIMNNKSWTKERVIFMLHVFKQLQFIVADKEMITFVPRPAKKDLQDSQVYQDRQKQAEIEKVLYYSNYNQLKNLFSQWIGHEAKEEVSYGL